jgi:hypothetical protein
MQRRNSLKNADSWSLLLGLGLVLTCAQALAADFKLAGNCLVYDYDRNTPAGSVIQTSYQWDGACDAGGFATGQGSLRALWNGRPDEDSTGTMVAGRLEGRARTTSASGYVFEGMYQAGERRGHGILVRTRQQDLVYRYVGEFSGGVPSGHGVLDRADGRHYVGAFRAGEPDGRGVETGSRGTDGRYRYEGEFVGGKWSGHGVLSWARGDRYEGEFRAGKCEGRGAWVWRSGQHYEGWFANGLPDGWGKFTAVDGSVIIDHFAQGRPLSQADSLPTAGAELYAVRP